MPDACCPQRGVLEEPSGPPVSPSGTIHCPLPTPSAHPPAHTHTHTHTHLQRLHKLEVGHLVGEHPLPPHQYLEKAAEHRQQRH